MTASPTATATSEMCSTVAAPMKPRLPAMNCSVSIRVCSGGPSPSAVRSGHRAERRRGRRDGRPFPDWRAVFPYHGRPSSSGRSRPHARSRPTCHPGSHRRPPRRPSRRRTEAGTSGRRASGKKTAASGGGADASGAPPGDVRSVRRALTLLSLFDAELPSATLSELARRSALATSTVQRLLQTLEREHFVGRDEDGAYAPGPAFLRLGLLAVRDMPLRERAGPTSRGCRPRRPRRSTSACSTSAAARCT